MTVKTYIDKVEPPLKEIVVALRHIVLACDDTIVESVKWGVPTYGMAKNICSIMAHKSHVNLQLFKAGLLADTSPFEGTGKEMRHIKFRNVEDIDEKEVKKFISQLIKLELKG